MKKQTILIFAILVLIVVVFVVLRTVSIKNTKEPIDARRNILAHGSSLHGANGIMFDKEDNLHVACVLGREIVVIEPETGEVLKRIGVNLGVECPDDLTFGPDGSLYWTSIITGEVGRLSPDGVKTSQRVRPGVNPIAFSDDGRLFVGLCFYGDALFELDPDLIDQPRPIAEKLGFLNGFDFGPDGFLYGPIWTKGQVVRIDVDSGSLTPVADGFGTPAAAKFDSLGRLHVVDYLRGEVLRVDLDTGSKQIIATIAPGLDNLALDSKNRLFVSCALDGFIVEVLADGTTRTVSEGGMILPGGVAVLPRPEGGESVFVADLWSLREFNGLTGEERSDEGVRATDGTASPMTVSSDGDNLVLSSWLGGAVQVWNPKTRKVVENYRDFVVPMNAIRFQGDLVVAELGSELEAGRVVRVSKEERLTILSGLSVPAGLAADEDNLWVSDFAAGEVLQIIANGNPLLEPILFAEGLSFPEGLAVDIDGNLLVVETGTKRLLRIIVSSSPPAISTIVEGLEIAARAIQGMQPTWAFNGVAVGPSGAIYITGDAGRVLYRFKPSN